MDSGDGFLDEYYYYNEDEDDEEDDDVTSYPGTYCGFPPSFLFSQNYSLPRPRYITPEEAERNAQELLKEEEREKEKADKKRLKKKRQKDRKRQQKLQEAENVKPSPEERTVTPDNNNGGRTGEAENKEKTTPRDSAPSRDSTLSRDSAPSRDSSPSGSDDDLDLGSTFVLQAQKKMENKPRPERKERGKEAARDRGSKERPPPPERARTQPPTSPPQPPNNINVLDRFRIQESLDLANIGNNMASQERFPEALHYYTEAIKLQPSEYRFLGNRSYVYERLGRYEEAKRDADTALTMQPHFLKGHFRKGKAMKGLKRYSEAIAAFQEVLLFDVNHVEAAGEIVQCQQRMQEAMTSTRVKVLSSAPLSPPATPPVSAPGQNNKVFVPRNIYNTKCETAKSSAEAAGRASGVMVHSKLYPVWVGNVTNNITENVLRAKFQPFGLIHSIRILHTRTCAFINYTNKGSAEAAFRSLQGLNVEGTTFVLQLRNPEHDAARAAPGAVKVGK